MYIDTMLDKSETNVLFKKKKTKIFKINKICRYQNFFNVTHACARQIIYHLLLIYIKVLHRLCFYFLLIVNLVIAAF